MGGLFDLQYERGVRPGLGLQGLPQLKASEIIRPTEYTFVESASIFTEFEFKRAVRVWIPGQRRTMRAVPNHMPTDGASIISSGLFVPSVNGILELLAPGKWFINLAIVTAEGTQVRGMYSDAAFAIGSLDTADSEDPNSWIALFQPRVMAAPTTYAPTAATTEAVAAAVGRRYLYIKNVSTGGQRVSLGFGAAAVLDRGITLQPGEWKEFDALDGVTEQAVNVIANAVGGALAIQTGT